MKATLKSKTKKAAKATSAAATNRGQLMNGAEVLVASLEREGVDTIFAYPGGASQFLHQALTKSKKIRTILPRHEQGGGFMAAGYSRATGRVGVCMATSGPGATNLVTALADAFMDSIPLVSITGQVPSYNIGKGAFQETDFFGLTLPVVKHSYLVMDARDIPRIVKEAFYIASSGRPGPVVIDIPKDVQISMTPADLSRQDRTARLQAGEEGRRSGAQRIARPDREGGEAGALRGRRHHFLGRVEGTARIRGADEHSGVHHADGHRLFPGEPSALAEMARHARHLLREPRGERGRPAAGLRRALRRPRDRQGLRVRQARHHRPHRHRLRRVQQEQARASAHPERREVRAGTAQRDHPQGRPRAENLPGVDQRHRGVARGAAVQIP